MLGHVTAETTRVRLCQDAHCPHRTQRCLVGIREQEEGTPASLEVRWGRQPSWSGCPKTDAEERMWVLEVVWEVIPGSTVREGKRWCREGKRATRGTSVRGHRFVRRRNHVETPQNQPSRGGGGWALIHWPSPRQGEGCSWAMLSPLHLDTVPVRR